MAAQQIVAPENMTALVNSLVDKRIDLQGKQKQKALLKTALKEARNKTQVAKTPPGKLNPGDKPKGNLRKVSFGIDKAPNSKRAKKSSNRNLEKDYKTYKRQQRAPNPYASRGRGRG